MPTQPPLLQAPTGFEPVPARVLGEIQVLPCDLYIWRGSRAMLYAARGADLRTVVSRSQQGIAMLVREGDGDLLRGALAASLPRVMDNAGMTPDDRARTVYSIAAKVLLPVFDRARQLDRDGLGLAHTTIDAITAGAASDAMLWAMVSAAPRRIATHTHAINTAIYALLLARASGISGSDDLRNLARGAMLHDVGKNRIPREIVDKPGPLDHDEWITMRGHVRVGYDMVIRGLGFVPPYAHIITEHHERLDGTGYPGGPGSAGIPIDSQIVGIADAFDALTCRRPYRDAVTPFEALRLMRVTMHGQFRDELLCSFIRLLGGREASRAIGGDSLEEAAI
jgi:putative nucleotidyltransferase with HDIG domain